MEALAAKALGTRAQLVRAFRRTLRGDGGSGAPLKTGALRPAQDFVLLGVQVGLLLLCAFLRWSSVLSGMQLPLACHLLHCMRCTWARR